MGIKNFSSTYSENRRVTPDHKPVFREKNGRFFKFELGK